MRRFLHTFPEAPELAGRRIIHATPLVDPRAPQVPHFTVMGQGSILQVQLPPSVELVAKRNALTGVLGTGASQAVLTSRLRVARSPLRRLFARQPVLQQKVVGTSPLTCVLGSENRHLSAVELNGSIDWIVKSPVLASTGRQLHFFARSGWRPGSAPFPHVEVSGRGWLCLSTPAPPVQITVAAGEQVLVSKKHLSAYSVDSNASHPVPVPTHVNFEFPAIKTKETINEMAEEAAHDAAEQVATEHSRLRHYWRTFMHYKTKTMEFLAPVTHLLQRLTRSGNAGAFIEICGPATVLVSSAARPPHIRSSEKNSQQV